MFNITAYIINAERFIGCPIFRFACAQTPLLFVQVIWL
jgi:uncharacterized membrane protein YhdT